MPTLFGLIRWLVFDVEVNWRRRILPELIRAKRTTQRTCWRYLDTQKSVHIEPNIWCRGGPYCVVSFWFALFSHSAHDAQRQCHWRKIKRHAIWRPQLLPVASKSHKRVHFGSYSGGDLSITVQPILKVFTVLEMAIQGLHSFFCNHLDPEKRDQVGLPSTTRYANGRIWFFSETTKASSFNL